MNIIKRNPQLVAYAFVVLGFLGVVYYQQVNNDERDRQICVAVIENRIVVRNIVDFAIGSGSSQEATSFREYVHRELERAPKICERASVDTQEMFDRAEAPPLREPRPSQDQREPEEPTAPTTQPPTTIVVEVRSYGPVAADRVDRSPPPTTTTSTSTTTTTEPPIIRIPRIIGWPLFDLIF